tara:strand:- start:692 stop:2617 length:1926 start_codon:yes stop_codon:yes gene_type:complete
MTSNIATNFTHVYVSNSSTTTTIIGNGTDGIEIYGLQIEEGSTATNYIPSTDTFTSRLGNATYVDSNGLIKTAYRNLIHETDWTVDGTVNTWIMSAMTISTVNEINPFGLAEHVANVSGSQAGLAYQLVSLTNTSNTLSVYAKANDSHQFNLISQADDSHNKSQAATFNLTTGTVTDTFNGGTGSIENVGNGWFRCILHTTHDTNYLLLNPHNRPEGNAAYSNLGRSSQAGTTSMYFYGPQVVDNGSEAGEFHPNLTATQSGPPRYSHDPETLVPTGLYLEPAATQLFRITSAYTSHWQDQGTTSTNNSGIAPDGTNTAKTVTQDTSGFNTHQFRRAFYSTSGTTYTYSVFVKRTNLDIIQIGFNNDVGADSSSARFNLSNGTVDYEYNSTVNATIKPYKNGWYRLSITNLANETGYRYVSIIFWKSGAAASGIVFDGDGTSSFQMWGGQIESGSFPTSYIYEGEPAMTRAADTYTSTATTVLDRDGGNKESFFKTNTFTAFGHCEVISNGKYGRFFSINRNNGEKFTMFNFPSNLNIQMRTRHDSDYDYLETPLIADQVGTDLKIATALAVNDGKSAHNAVLTVGDTSVTTWQNVTNVPNEMYIGSANSTGAAPLNEPLRRLTFWKTRLPDASLINITKL